MAADEKTDAELAELTKGCPEDPSHWQHYKGGRYVVVGSAIHESTLTPLVLYEPVGKYVIFARPLSEWYECVEVNGSLVPRFRKV